MKAIQFLIIFSILNCLNGFLTVSGCCKKFRKAVCSDGTVITGKGNCGLGQCDKKGCDCTGGCRKLGPIKPLDILGFDRDEYFHFALAINETHLAHNDRKSIKVEPATVFKADFEAGRVVRFNEYLSRFTRSKPRPLSKVLEDVSRDVGKTDYCLLSNNCEHFVTRWYYGTGFSTQADPWRKAGKKFLDYVMDERNVIYSARG